MDVTALLIQIKAVFPDMFYYQISSTKRSDTMYERILVPVSFDAERNAKGAMAVATALCAKGGAITCLHVLEQLPGYATQYLPEGHLEATKQEIMHGLQALVDPVDGATATVVEGHASRSILSHAEHNNIDLIIIASHQPGMQDYLLGSTAAKVVRHAKCAVHVLR
jgi:nucleotide-binding universal stress UspA family protein